MTATRKAHREFCGICRRVSRVSFAVPTDVWRLSLHESYWNEIVCLSCFTEHADERGVDWSASMEFHPTSNALLERQRAAWAKGEAAEPSPRIGNIGGTTEDGSRSDAALGDIEAPAPPVGGRRFYIPVLINGAPKLAPRYVSYEDVVALAGKRFEDQLHAPRRLWTVTYENAKRGHDLSGNGVLSPGSDKIEVQDGTDFDVVDASRA